MYILLLKVLRNKNIRLEVHDSLAAASILQLS